MINHDYEINLFVIVVQLVCKQNKLFTELFNYTHEYLYPTPYYSNMYYDVLIHYHLPTLVAIL